MGDSTWTAVSSELDLISFIHPPECHSKQKQWSFAQRLRATQLHGGTERRSRGTQGAAMSIRAGQTGGTAGPRLNESRRVDSCRLCVLPGSPIHTSISAVWSALSDSTSRKKPTAHHAWFLRATLPSQSHWNRLAKDLVAQKALPEPFLLCYFLPLIFSLSFSN